MPDATEIIPIVVGVLAIVGGVLTGLLYVIRAEVKKGNAAAEVAATQLVPNHGTSLRDAIDRIERRQADDRETYLDRIAEVHDDVKAVRVRLDSHIDNHERRA